MGFNFRKSFKILPGVRINVGKKGVSTSVGTRGAHITVGKNGTRASVGIPGTGISYSEKISSSKKSEKKSSVSRSSCIQTKDDDVILSDSIERGKKLYAWENMKKLLIHVVALPFLAFVLVSALLAPNIGAYVAMIVTGVGVYKFWKKIKDI